MSIDATALPSELVAIPQPLVGFYGLDLTHNTVHKAVWDTFSSNRKVDRAPVNFKVLPNNYEFPVCKPKRASYEWYQPKGILKRNWMLKHLHVLPAVVAYFQELEWNDADWPDKQLHCVAVIQSLKSALQERNTRVCIVLLQKSAPLPPGNDLLATERATSLASACGISNKMLFVLPYTEHFSGYALRLESAFLDMAQSYYTLMAKRIRSHRDQLISTHTTLKIRHQFKLGFIAEIRQDLSTALKHYTQAYGNLDELRLTDVNCFEVKTLAGFLNYKICRLMFKLKVPRDAINHFMSHLEKYKNRVGYKDLLFEHNAWLSTQHSVFAEIFCDAVRNGLPALQTQHPGIYFHKAAEYMAKRREHFQQCCSTLIHSPTEANLSNSTLDSTSILSNEYFGLYALKVGDTISEQQILSVLRETEKSFNHSTAIINLLSQAMAQFKIYKCLRFRKKLAIDMAEEYFKSGDHAKALTLYSLMLPDYRDEKWMHMFSNVLLKTLRAAMLAGSVSDYLACSLEAISPKIVMDYKDRVIVLENLWKVLSAMPPVTQSHILPELSNNWEKILQHTKSPIHIDLNKLTELFEICVTFEADELKLNEEIRVQLIIRTLTDVPIKLHNISIYLSDDINNYKLPVSKYAVYANLKELSDQENSQQPVIYAHKVEHELKLEPGQYFRFLVVSDAQHFMENTQLQASRFDAYMGTDKLNVHLTKSIKHAPKPFRHYIRSQCIEDILPIQSTCCIAPTFHIVTQSNIDNGISMLVNEYFAVATTVTNSHNVFLQHVGLNVSVPNHLRQKVFLCTELSPTRQKLHSNIQMDFGELPMNGSNTFNYYVLSLIATTVDLQQKIWYSLNIMPTSKSSNIIVTPLHTAKGIGSSEDSSPENGPTNRLKDNKTNAAATTTPANASNTTAMAGIVRSTPAQLLAKNVKPVHIEMQSEGSMFKSCDDTIHIKCDLEIKFLAQLYSLNKKPLLKLYRGERFLLRVTYEVEAPCQLDILESYFISEHNFVQSSYSFKGSKYGKVYESNDKLEDVIMLRTFAVGEQQDNTINSALEQLLSESKRKQSRSSDHGAMGDELQLTDIDAQAGNKELSSRIALNRILSQAANIRKLSKSEDIAALIGDGAQNTEAEVQTAPKEITSRLIYNKALDAVQVTGHCRGYIKGVYCVEQETKQQSNKPIFGIYCIKWRRHGQKEENESKFVIHGLPLEDPPLNIYCTIEERMFVKMPMTLKVVLKNPTYKVLHLTATLNISFADNFICSGHKQLDISLFAWAEKTLVYNLYPLYVGWQYLPELMLEYNTQIDPSIDESKNALLLELVQRSIPKKVFVLPPLKQQPK